MECSDVLVVKFSALEILLLLQRFICRAEYNQAHRLTPGCDVTAPYMGMQREECSASHCAGTADQYGFADNCSYSVASEHYF